MSNEQKQNTKSETSLTENVNNPELEIESINQRAYIETALGDKYRIIEKIGSGGCGIVYKAEHINLGINVAIKVIHNYVLNSQTGQNRLEQEAKALSRIDSPYVIKTMDYLLEPLQCIVMEYFPGIPLDEYIRENGPLSAELAIELWEMLCDGLEATHSINLVHRDLKPSNILIMLNGPKLSVKILDFGLVRLIQDTQNLNQITTTGELVGTPQYMSPEQWFGRKVDNRTDIFSLGCVMYEAITSQVPFTGSLAEGLFHKVTLCDPEPFSKKLINNSPKLLPELEKIIRKSLAKAPNDRYQCAKDIKSDLQQIKSGHKLKLRLKSTKEKKSFLLIQIIIGFILIISSLGWCFRNSILENIIQTLSTNANKLQRNGQIKEAINSYQQINTLSDSLSFQNQYKLQALRSLSSLLKEDKNWTEAEKTEHTLKKLIGFNMTPQCKSYFNQAQNFLANGQTVQAEILATKALAEAEKAGKHTIDYSTCIDLLAQIALLNRQLPKAQELEERSLQICQDLLDSKDREIAIHLNNLGEILAQQGKNKDAEKLFLQAIAINTESDKAGLLPNYNLLGILYLKDGKLQEALSYFQRAYEIHNKFNGPKGGDNLVFNIAVAYEKLGQYDSSLESYKKSLDIAKIMDKDQDPSYEITWTKMGNLYKKMKNYKMAEKCYTEGIKLRTKEQNMAQLKILYKNLAEIKNLLKETASKAQK